MLTKLLRSKFVRDTLVLQAGKMVNAGMSLVAFILAVRLMGLEGYGVWGLALSLFQLWQTLDFTGIGMTTSTQLGMAVGRGDAGRILDLLAFYVKVSLAWAALTATVLLLAGQALASQLYGEPRIGMLAGWYSLTFGADALYTMVVLSLQSRRLMREMVILQNVNQAILTTCVVVAMLLQATPESMVAARLVYTYTTMLLAFAVYTRLRGRGAVAFPPLPAVLARAWRVPAGAHWRSGVVMALDKNAATLYTQLPLTLVGVFAGERAAGILKTALDSINRSSILTNAVLDNLQAVVPQYVGRGDFAGLWRSFGRVLAGMAAGGVVLYALLALFAPLVVPLLLGEEARAAVPALIVLCVYGAITAAGGIFGPLYRALDMNRVALAVKLLTALVVLVPGALLVMNAGAVGGAWVVNALYALSVAGTAATTLPALRGRARTEQPA